MSLAPRIPVKAKPVTKPVATTKPVAKPASKRVVIEDDEPQEATHKGRVIRGTTKPVVSSEAIAEAIANALADVIDHDVTIDQARNKRTWIIKTEIANVPKPRQHIEVTVLVSKPDRIRVNLAVINTLDVFNTGTRVFEDKDTTLAFLAALADNNISSAGKIKTRVAKTTDANEED